jgi:hypothetical protein
MLNHTENKKMCLVGPGEPMGRLLRRHWLPFMVAADLTAGGDPQDVPLAGEKFVAWRDANGRPALFEDGCLHRGASMLWRAPKAMVCAASITAGSSRPTGPYWTPLTWPIPTTSVVYADALFPYAKQAVFYGPTWGRQDKNRIFRVGPG